MAQERENEHLIEGIDIQETGEYQEWLASHYEEDELEYDGQPDEYTEWQDLYGGDDYDHGQFDEFF